MIIVKVKKGEKIDMALKRYKFKFRKYKVNEEIRKRQQFDKPSVIKREQKKKAIYINGLRIKEDL